MNIMGGNDLGLLEVNEAADLVQKAAARDANIIFGTSFNGDLGDEIRVTVIATGFEDFDNDPVLAELEELNEENPSMSKKNEGMPDEYAGQTEPDPSRREPAVDDDPLDVPDFLKNAAAKLRN